MEKFTFLWILFCLCIEITKRTKCIHEPRVLVFSKKGKRRLCLPRLNSPYVPIVRRVRVCAQVVCIHA